VTDLKVQDKKIVFRQFIPKKENVQDYVILIVLHIDMY
jgi:hypothetical protein